MKIFHVADTHLGYSAYRRVSADGINQREIDVYDSFSRFVDYCLENKPDLILHAGDLFDSVRPNNRAITFAIDQILRISEKKIPFVVIAGNHEHPKLRETGHIFSIFDHLDNVYPVYSSSHESIQLDIGKEKVTIHPVPQSSTKEDFENNLRQIRKDNSSNYNILMVHGSVMGIESFCMNEFNELVIPKKYLDSYFDYVALGHFHKFSKVTKKAYYSGSTECFSFNEAGEKKGFIKVELNKEKIDHEFIQLKTRNVVDYPSIECSNLTLNEVMSKIYRSIEDIDPANKVFRIVLDGVPSHIFRGLDFSSIRKKCSDSIHFEIRPRISTEMYKNRNSGSKIDALSEEFTRFINENEIQDKDKLLALGLDYIKKVESKKEEK
ncbi:MAG: exonuclease SbcCD subunit D [Candidatus Thermoplasmatota archaeon]|nr:exonuclease SbcCD subunit D [Candidatus Thermoplasmatota archaeon]